MTPADATKPTDPLGALATKVETDTPDQVLSPDEQRAAAEGEAQLAKIKAGVQTFADKLLRAVRARLSVKLPELREHWTDANLAEFAAALPPVVEKRLGMLGPLMGAYPEEAMLLLAGVPLVMGYMSAVSDHADKGKQEQLPAPAPLAAAAGPGPLEHPMAQVVG